MTQSSFAVHLGGGLYLESDGSLTQGTPATDAVYQAPFKLPIDPKKAKDAMEGVQKALKDVNKDPAVLEKFAEFGFDYRLLDLLSGVGKIAGIVAPYLAVIAIAYDLLRIFGVFKSGPSAFEELMKQRFDELEKNVESIKVMIQLKDLRTGRLGVENFLTDVSSYVKTSMNAELSVAQLEADRLRLLGIHDSKSEQVALLLDQATWISNFDREQYTRVWPLMQGILHTLPGAVGAPPQRADLPPDGSLTFDHRLMVPLACYAATVYLTCIRAIIPEHRSTGEFRDKLRLFAVKLDDLAQHMRTFGLARTIYKKEHFGFPTLLRQDEVELTQLFPPKFKVSSQCNRFAVGAMDLRYGDDRFFGPFLDELWRAEFYGQSHPPKHGGMNFRWVPPAQIVPGPFAGTFEITNAQECADAANAQSEKDYADLLSVSGYTELVRLAALMRSESTEPLYSQTVSTTKPQLFRDPQAQTSVVIESAPIFGTGVITSPAIREPQDCVATLGVGTQPIKRARPANYRVILRTLRNRSLSRYSSPEYADFNRPFYIRDPSDARCMVLDVFESDAELDHQVLMTGPSPRDMPRHAEGVIQLKAHTYDWWIPVKPPFQIGVDFSSTMAERRAVGWAQSTKATSAPPAVFSGAQPGPRPLPILSDQLISASDRVSGYDDIIPSLFWQSGEQTWEGQTRDPKEKTVEIEYTLKWVGDRLSLRLKNNPADRNYVVFLVLEETLSTGHVLHTATPIPVNGQLTYVPQKYFDEESAAWARAAKAIADFNRRFSESHDLIDPNPPDPVLGWLRPGDLTTAASVQRFVELAEQHQPELLRAVLGDVERTAALARLAQAGSPAAVGYQSR